MKGRVITGPTPMQKRGVDNILSGNYNAAAPALRDAGYKPSTAIKSQDNFFKAKGVGLYLKTLSKVAKKRWNVSLPDKVALTYLDGLEATKLYGKNAIEAPDYMARKAYADRFAEFFGWTHGDLAPGAKLQQFNFFSVSPEERTEFNDKFKDFLKQL